VEECKTTAQEVFLHVSAFMDGHDARFSSAIVGTCPGKTPICPVDAGMMTMSTFKYMKRNQLAFSYD
jgi:hypothetical protein